MMKRLTLSLPKSDKITSCTINLAASKSISNRALIIDALCAESSNLQNLAEARDTRLMTRLLHDPSHTIDVMDAGTTMRFLTGYFALTNRSKILTGTTRMKQRPIGILVDALRKIGANISYLEKDGYPPHETLGFKSQNTDQISIPGDISSQYISALLMMAPSLPNGLEIVMTGKIMSRPYIEMTLGLMSRFGATYTWNDNAIKIPCQSYSAIALKVESDWSAASYWYSMVALSQAGEVTLLGLEENSLQGDRQIAEIMKLLGVGTSFQANGITILKEGKISDHIAYDFSSCPDLAPTVMATCAAMGVTCTATGLESLRIKETDRIAALQNELGKIGAHIKEESGSWELFPASTIGVSPVTFKTYEDHRMAMALAPLALRIPVVIEEPDVVQKSYPNFWSDLSLAGLVSELNTE